MTATATLAPIATSDEAFTPQAADSIWATLKRNANPAMIALILDGMTAEGRTEIAAGEARHRFAHMHCERGAICCS